MELEGSSFLCYCYTISFLIISCFLDSAAAMDTSEHSNIISDQDALLFLKARISHDPNQILTKNWSASNGSSSSVCDWIGVSCAVRHYRVKSLNISNMGLTGTIVPQLGNLSFLSSMDLSGNNFQGDLPSELAQLRRLKVLSLSQNALSGEFPSWVGSLNQLESLYLNNNSFTGSIPSSITNLTNLKNLKLYFISLWSNMLSGPLPSDLHRCSRLTYLDLSYNNFSGQIPKTFWNMENLERAFFVSNNLVGTVPKELNNLTNLQSLNLGSNHLTEYGSEGLVSTKCDVYSFGILLMEVFTRKRPDDEMFNESLTLPGWISSNNSTESALVDIIDDSLLNTIEEQHFDEMTDYVMKIMNVALNCTNKFPKERSGMEEIVATLNKIKLKL